jgi:hypothetical protein
MGELPSRLQTISTTISIPFRAEEIVESKGASQTTAATSNLPKVKIHAACGLNCMPTNIKMLYGTVGPAQRCLINDWHHPSGAPPD